MIDYGLADDLMGFWATAGAEGGRGFSHTGLRDQSGHVGHAAVIQSPYGLQAVFVANSPPAGIDVVQTLIAAFNDANTRPPRTAPDRPWPQPGSNRETRAAGWGTAPSGRETVAELAIPARTAVAPARWSR
jgi:hypothetical protein